MTQTFGPYSPVKTVADGWYFISGQIGVRPGTKDAESSVEAQTHQALQNMRSLLQEHSIGFEDIVKTTVFLKNMDDFAAMNSIYLEYFPEPRPARSCVEVSSLPKVAATELLVEIEAVAYKSPKENK